MANTLNLNVNMENLTEEERNQLLKLVRKSTTKVWKPEYDETYYHIITDGKVSNFKWRDDDIDKNLYEIGNCYRTEEEAVFIIEKLKVIAELKRFAREYNEREIDWNDPNERKYYLSYSYNSHKIFVNFTSVLKESNIYYFTSEKIAQQAIEAIGADRLKKYYFEVEDK